MSCGHKEGMGRNCGNRSTWLTVITSRLEGKSNGCYPCILSWMKRWCIKTHNSRFLVKRERDSRLIRSVSASQLVKTVQSVSVSLLRQSRLVSSVSLLRQSRSISSVSARHLVKTVTRQHIIGLQLGRHQYDRSYDDTKMPCRRLANTET